MGRADDRGIIIGIGNSFRRDDGAGLAVVSRLLDRGDPTSVVGQPVDVVGLSGEPTALIDAWARRPFAIVVDAIAGEGIPGTIDVAEVGEEPLPWRARRDGTHDVDPTAAIELGRALELLPDAMAVVGVYGMDFRHGEGLSASVEARIDDICDRVLSLAAGLVAPANGEQEGV